MSFDTRNGANDNGGESRMRGLLSMVNLKIAGALTFSIVGTVFALAENQMILITLTPFEAAAGWILLSKNSKPLHHDNDNDIDPSAA